MYQVAVIGMVNAGKSSLLSALADRPGQFADADRPATTRNVQRELAGPLLLIDTPGLDAELPDAEQAMATARSADTVLWCHSLRMGELVRTELEALQQFAGDRRSVKKVHFVLTHADNLGNRPQARDCIRKVSAVMARQLKKVVGLPWGRRCSFHVVGLHRYWFARQRTSNEFLCLLDESGVPRLRSFLLRLAARLAAGGRP